MAVGSDGQACASCHFHAGLTAGRRTSSTLGSALCLRIRPSLCSVRMVAAPTTSCKHRLPFHKVTDPGDQNSPVLFDTNDIASSAGVFAFTFTGVNPPGLNDTDSGNIASPDPSLTLAASTFVASSRATPRR